MNATAYPDRTQSPIGILANAIDHEGVALHTLALGPLRAWTADSIGRALGYADPADVSRNAKGIWRKHLREGIDFTIADATLCDAINALWGEWPPLVEAGDVLLLPQGVRAVCLLTRRPGGAALFDALTERFPSEMSHPGQHRSTHCW